MKLSCDELRLSSSMGLIIKIYLSEPKVGPGEISVVCYSVKPANQFIATPLEFIDGTCGKITCGP